MNLTLDQYFNGLDRTARNVPSVLERWDSLDSHLQEHFADELQWMLVVQPEFFDRAIREHRDCEAASRITSANAVFRQYARKLAEVVGVNVDEIICRRVA